MRCKVSIMAKNDGLLEAPPPGEKSSFATAIRRWGPLIGLAGLMALVFGMGWHRLLTFQMIGQNYEKMTAFVAENILTAVAVYMAAYVAVVALSLPGALIMTLAGGLLFGWLIGASATVVAATIGATIIFLVAKTSFGEALAEKAGPWLGKLRAGFQENAMSYLLFLRLVPAFPFVIVNLAPALLGVPVATFVTATALGIIPGTVAFSVAGSSLGSVIRTLNANHAACLAKGGPDPEMQCPYEFDPAALVSKELLIAFALLGVIALIPVALKRWSNRDAGR
jgi:uncharacterized membrane protein YdjX (TVP38/TMEM64 family)